MSSTALLGYISFCTSQDFQAMRMCFSFFILFFYYSGIRRDQRSWVNKFLVGPLLEDNVANLKVGNEIFICYYVYMYVYIFMCIYMKLGKYSMIMYGVGNWYRILVFLPFEFKRAIRYLLPPHTLVKKLKESFVSDINSQFN